MAGRRWIGLVAFGVGVVACGYFAWCQHRLRGTTIVSESPDWPRRWPYPDEWLMRWERHLDAAYPTSPGHFKMHGELDRLRERVALCMVATWSFAYCGLGVAVWPRRLQTPNQALQQTPAA